MKLSKLITSSDINISKHKNSLKHLITNNETNIKFNMFSQKDIITSGNFKKDIPGISWNDIDIGQKSNDFKGHNGIELIKGPEINGVKLLLAPTDVEKQWGCNNINTGAINYDNGYENTQKLINLECSDLCYNLDDGWFVPSISELQAIFNNRSILPGINLVATYWTSTEFDNQFAYYLAFNNGSINYMLKSGIFYNVRYVRAF